MNDAPLQCCPPDQGAAPRGDRSTLHVLHVVLRKSVTGNHLISRPVVVALASEYERAFGLAQSCRRFGQSVEHGLQIERGAADDLEHVGGRGLLLQGFAQLVKQAGVLDSDDGLRGKVSDQLDLLIAERSDLLAINDDGAYKLVSLKHGNAKEGSATGDLDGGDAQRITFGIGRFGSEVRNVNDLLSIEDSAKASLWAGPYWSMIPQLAIGLRNIM